LRRHPHAQTYLAPFYETLGFRTTSARSTITACAISTCAFMISAASFRCADRDARKLAFVVRHKRQIQGQRVRRDQKDRWRRLADRSFEMRPDLCNAISAGVSNGTHRSLEDSAS